MLAVLGLTACGGGSDAPNLSGTTAGVNNQGASTGANNGSGNTTSGTPTLLKLVAGQVLFSGTAFSMDQYQSADGVGPTARTSVSPVTAFGFRPQANNRPTATGDVVHTPLLLTMKQRSADVQAGQVPQVFQFEFPSVDMVVSADHDVVHVNFPAGAKAWAFYGNAAGATVSGSSAALSDALISLQPIADDTTSDLLSLSIDPLMRDIVGNASPAAQAVWNGVAAMHGTYDTSIVIGNTSMETDAFVPLPSASIAFGDAGAGLATVSGSQLAGGVKLVAN